MNKYRKKTTNPVQGSGGSGSLMMDMKFDEVVKSVRKIVSTLRSDHELELKFCKSMFKLIDRNRQDGSISSFGLLLFGPQFIILQSTSNSLF